MDKQCFMVDFDNVWVYNDGQWPDSDEQHERVSNIQASCVISNTLHFNLPESTAIDRYNVKVTNLVISNPHRERVIELAYLRVTINLDDPLFVKISEGGSIAHPIRFNLSDSDFQVLMRLL